MKKILLLILIAFSFIGLTGCNEVTDEPVNVDLTGVVFKSLTYTYDGNPVGIYVENLPEGLTVEYVGNGVVEVGQYEIKAIIKDSNGNKLATLLANIRIVLPDPETQPGTEPNPGTQPEPTPTPGNDYDLSNVVFLDVEYTYDGNPVSIYLSNLPEGLTVEYSGNGVTEVGTHEVTATVKTADGTVLATYKANIVIVDSSDVELPLV